MRGRTVLERWWKVGQPCLGWTRVWLAAAYAAACLPMDLSGGGTWGEALPRTLKHKSKPAEAQEGQAAALVQGLSCTVWPPGHL